GQLFGFDVADSGGAQNGDDVGGNLSPVALDLPLDIYFMNREFWVDLIRVAGFAVEKFRSQVKRVREAVRRVNAHHERTVAQARELETGRRCHAGLAHTALATEE